MKLTISKAERASRNPHMDDMPKGSAHWCVTLTTFDGIGHRSASFYYSQGPAIVGEPKLAEIMECLISEALSIEQAGTFDSWCSELGLDSDSRRAARCWRAAWKNTDKLKALLGADFDAWAEKIQGGAQ